MGRYKFGEVDNERYYQIPKGLFTNPIYKDMGIDAKVIYAFLKDRMSLSNRNGWKDENGDIYLLFSQESIADILNCSVSTISRAMRSLRQYDLIDVMRQGLNKPNKIYIRHIKTCTGDLSGHVTDANQDTSPVQTNETEYSETEYSETENKRKGCVTSPKKSYAEFVTMTEEEYKLSDIQSVDQRSTSGIPSGSIGKVRLGKDSIGKNKEKKKHYFLDSYSKNEELISSLKDFIEMRKKIKAPMTERAVNLMLSKLSSMANDDTEKIKIINQSIMNSWKGIFPIKEEKRHDRFSARDDGEQSIDWGAFDGS